MTRGPNQSEMLGSALLQMTGCNCPKLIPYEHAKLMAPAQIKSLVHFDHYPIRKADGGSNHPSNLVPRFIAEHREKTAKVDAPAMAKDRDIGKAQAKHDALMARKAGEPNLEAALNYLLPKARSRLQSRGFDKRVTKGFDGKVRPRRQTKR